MMNRRPRLFRRPHPDPLAAARGIVYSAWLGAAFWIVLAVWVCR